MNIYPILFEPDSYTKHIRIKFYDLKERMDTFKSLWQVESCQERLNLK